MILRAARFWLVAGVIAWTGGLEAADAPVRVAVVPVGAGANTAAACAVLQSAAEKRPAFATVEREAVNAVLSELRLAAAVAARDVGRLQQILPADLFIFADDGSVNGAPYVRAAAVESRGGAVLCVRILPSGAGDATQAAATGFVADALEKFRALAQDGRRVAWLGVHPAVGSTNDAVTRALTALVEARLTEVPGIGLLDRSRLRQVGEEPSLSGIDQELRHSTVMLDAAWRLVDRSGDGEVALRARYLAGRSPTSCVVRVDAGALSTGVRDIVRQAGLLLTTPGDAQDGATAGSDELALLAARTSELITWKEFGLALETAEALYALAPTQQLYRVLLIHALESNAHGDLAAVVRATNIRVLYHADLTKRPSTRWAVFVDLLHYRARAPTPEDGPAVRTLLREQEEAEERVYQAKLAASGRGTEHAADTPVYWLARMERIRDIGAYRPGNVQAQLDLLRAFPSDLKQSALSGRPLPIDALDALGTTISRPRVVHFAQSPEGAAGYRAYLAGLYADSDPVCRLAGMSGAALTRAANIPTVVPAGLPENPELARQTARILLTELLVPPPGAPPSSARKAYSAHATWLFENLLLLDFDVDPLPHYFPPSPFRRPWRGADPVRMGLLASVLDVTAPSFGSEPAPLFHARAVRASGDYISSILYHLAVSGELERARRLAASVKDTALRASLRAVVEDGATGARAVPTAAKAPATGAWPEYAVTAAGAGFERHVRAHYRALTGESGDCGAKLLHLLPDGDILGVVEIEGAGDSRVPMNLDVLQGWPAEVDLRFMRLQLPGCQVLDDRRLERIMKDKNYDGVVRSAARGGGRWYLATRRGLLVVDERTLTPTWLTTAEGLAGNFVTAVCWFSGRLYVSTGGNMLEATSGTSGLFRYDPDTGVLEDLASERSVRSRNAWDGGRFDVLDMQPDPTGGTLLLRAAKGQGGISGVVHIWEYNVQSNTIAIKPAASKTQAPMLPSSRQEGIVLDGDIVFSIGSLAQDHLVSPWIVRPGPKEVRLDLSDDGFPLHAIQGLVSTAAGIVMVDRTGQTFLVRRRDRLAGYREWDHAPLGGGASEGALQQAAEAGDADAVRRALSQNANWRIRRRSGETALTLATTRGSEECLRALLDAGADVNYAALDGETALHTAARLGQTQVATLLLSRGAKPTLLRQADRATPLHLASRSGYGPLASLLAKHGADIEAVLDDRHNRHTPLMLAAQTNACGVLTTLLGQGARINARDRVGRTALLLATQEKGIEAVTLLLKAKADPNAADVDGYTPAMAAADRDLAAVLRALLAHGANPRATLSIGDSPSVLWRAVSAGSTNCVDVLLAAGVDINTRHNRNVTVMHVAAGWGKPETVRFLAGHPVATAYVDLSKVIDPDTDTDPDPREPSRARDWRSRASARAPKVEVNETGMRAGARPGAR